MSVKSPDISAPKFEAWALDTLAKFAHDAYLKMQEQAAQIEQLTRDRKDAINAYRDLLRRTEDDFR